MSDDAEYEEMRSHYRKMKEQIGGTPSPTNEQLEIAREIPELQKGLMEFCLASGRDLEDLNKFFRDVDLETTPTCAG